MFKSIDKRCIGRPILLSSRTDAESMRQNEERKFQHGLNIAPFMCAEVASRWKLELNEKLWVRNICYCFNISAVRSHVIDFIRETEFFPEHGYNIRFNYRLACKAGIDAALPDRNERRVIAEVSPFELEPWI
jgi:hypothetical protein